MNLQDIKIKPLIDTLRLEKIDDNEYFSKRYSGYISNSRLGLIDPNNDGSPEKFFAGLGANKIYSDALSFGSAVHELTLQPDLFELAPNLDKPTAKVGFIADFLYKRWLDQKFELSYQDYIDASDEINYYKGKMDDAKVENLKNKCIPYFKNRMNFESKYDGDKELIFLDQKSRERVFECISALNKNKDIQALLHPIGLLEDPISENEQAILLDVEIQIPEQAPFIFKLKAKLDNYTIDKESNAIQVGDVKTIGKILSEFDGPNGNFVRFSYYRELAIYCWLLSLAAKKYYNMDNPTITSNCFVVSTIPAYYTKVYKVTKSDFSKGWNEFIYLLKLAAKYYIEGYRFE